MYAICTQPLVQNQRNAESARPRGVPDSLGWGGRQIISFIRTKFNYKFIHWCWDGCCYSRAVAATPRMRKKAKHKIEPPNTQYK